MPIITAQLAAGYSAAQKTALLEHATQAIADSIQAPLPSIRIFLQESQETIVAGKLGADLLTFIAYLIEGRTEAQKAALILALNQAGSASIGISPKDIRVIIQDVPKTDMGVADGISAKQAGR
ncbi:tautomerase family protein [Pusillimonas sp. SM2304]|uniref:tautomerase family protein n=1 Tax=Pusillimonas sp. SM2304 TaxID=3073241 RepID=UPI0028751FD1|nr:tautomerase family protein [Pusillimonas sp. SM2304]MDS1139129.1 tautomerase family protein [Pusillimonas sp. SM2304]